jgi:hypothetical protein
MSDRQTAATVIPAERASQLMFELVMQGRTAWARPVIAIALAQKARHTPSNTKLDQARLGSGESRPLVGMRTA